MPNWCYNIVEIDFDNAQDKNTFLEKAGDDKSAFAFESFIKPPADDNENWYDINVKSLGTKWYPGDINVDNSVDTKLTISYDSAWSPASTAIGSVSDWMYENNISHKMTEYYNEPGMVFEGENTYIDGEIVDSAYGEVLANIYDYHLDEPEELIDTLESLDIPATDVIIESLKKIIIDNDEASIVDDAFPSQLLSDNYVRKTDLLKLNNTHNIEVNREIKPK